MSGCTFLCDYGFIPFDYVVLGYFDPGPCTLRYSVYQLVSSSDSDPGFISRLVFRTFDYSVLRSYFDSFQFKLLVMSVKDFDSFDPNFDYISWIRENLCDLVLIDDDSDPDCGRYFLVLGRYRLSSDTFLNSSEALVWLQNHPVNVALAVFSICREIDSIDSGVPSPVYASQFVFVRVRARD